MPKWLRERGVGDGGAGGGGEALGVWRQAGVALAVTGGECGGWDAPCGCESDDPSGSKYVRS